METHGRVVLLPEWWGGHLSWLLPPQSTIMSSQELKTWYRSRGWDIHDRMKGRGGKRFLIASARGTSGGGERQERYFFASEFNSPDSDILTLVFSVSGTALACEHVQKLVGRDGEAFLVQAGLLRMQEILNEDETPRKVFVDLHSRSSADEFRIASTATLQAERERAIHETLSLLAERQYRGNISEYTCEELLDVICVSEAVFNRAHEFLLKRGWIELLEKDGAISITPDGEEELARMQQRNTTMSISDLYTDVIEVLKQDGTRHANQKASVQRTRVFMDHSTFPVEAGDLVIRHMSNGLKETFKVIDPGFQERFHGIAAHYQMHVQNLGLPEAKHAISNITNNYNLSGPNARINQNSTDTSSNIANIDSRAIQCVERLRNEIRSMSLADEERTEALETLDDVESEVQSTSPRKRVISSLLKQLPTAEMITNIVTSLIGLYK